MTGAEVGRAFAVLGVPLRERVNAARPGDQAALDVIVAAAKADAMASFRRLILAAHPDVGGSEAETQSLLAARDVVKRVQLRLPAPRPAQVVVQVFRWQGNATTATTSQTSVRF